MPRLFSPGAQRALRLSGAALALVLIAAAPAQAQERRGWTVTIGAGAQIQPKYPGADDIGIGPMPDFDLRRTGDPIAFEAPDEGWGFGVLGRDSVIDIGPSLGFVNKRKNADVGAAVGEVGRTFEVGGFVQANVSPNFRLRVDARKGVNGHEGWVGDVSADFIARDGDVTIFSIGPRLRLADSDYHRAYYGVTPAASAATGLPVYAPGGGIHAVGVTTSLRHQFTYNWGMFGYAGYDRLVGDAADSPIVRAFGSRDQFSAGLALSYTFDIGR